MLKVALTDPPARPSQIIFRNDSHVLRSEIEFEFFFFGILSSLKKCIVGEESVTI